MLDPLHAPASGLPVHQHAQHHESSTASPIIDRQKAVVFMKADTVPSTLAIADSLRQISEAHRARLDQRYGKDTIDYAGRYGIEASESLAAIAKALNGKPILDPKNVWLLRNTDVQFVDTEHLSVDNNPNAESKRVFDYHHLEPHKFDERHTSLIPEKKIAGNYTLRAKDTLAHLIVDPDLSDVVPYRPKESLSHGGINFLVILRRDSTKITMKNNSYNQEKSNTIGIYSTLQDVLDQGARIHFDDFALWTNAVFVEAALKHPHLPIRFLPTDKDDPQLIKSYSAKPLTISGQPGVHVHAHLSHTAIQAFVDIDEQRYELTRAENNEWLLQTIFHPQVIDKFKGSQPIRAAITALQPDNRTTKLPISLHSCAVQIIPKIQGANATSPDQITRFDAKRLRQALGDHEDPLAHLVKKHYTSLENVQYHSPLEALTKLNSPKSLEDLGKISYSTFNRHFWDTVNEDTCLLALEGLLRGPACDTVIISYARFVRNSRKTLDGSHYFKPANRIHFTSLLVKYIGHDEDLEFARRVRDISGLEPQWRVKLALTLLKNWVFRSGHNEDVEAARALRDNSQFPADERMELACALVCQQAEIQDLDAARALRDNPTMDFSGREKIATILLHKNCMQKDIQAVLNLMCDETVADHYRSHLPRTLVEKVGIERIDFDHLRNLRETPDLGKEVQSSLTQLLLRHSVNDADAHVARNLSLDLELHTFSRESLLCTLVETLVQDEDIARMRSIRDDSRTYLAGRLKLAQRLIGTINAPEDRIAARALCLNVKGSIDSFNSGRQADLALTLLKQNGTIDDIETARKVILHGHAEDRTAKLARYVAENYGAPQDIEAVKMLRNQTSCPNEFMKMSFLLFNKCSFEENQAWLNDWKESNRENLQGIVLQEALSCLKSDQQVLAK